MYWKSATRREGRLANDHYQRIYTSLLGLDLTFYAGKRILDIGCGPRGSLEWADMAAERVGLDPLVESYRELGIDQHKMRYVNAPSEQIPFEDGHFDVILSLNSLDHVDDLDKTIQEIIRVLAENGCFCLMVEIHPHPTIAEPIVLSWDVIKKFQPALKIREEHHYEGNPDQRGVAGAMVTKIPFNHQDSTERSGFLVAKLVKNAA